MNEIIRDTSPHKKIKIPVIYVDSHIGHTMNKRNASQTGIWKNFRSDKTVVRCWLAPRLKLKCFVLFTNIFQQYGYTYIWHIFLTECYMENPLKSHLGFTEQKKASSPGLHVNQIKMDWTDEQTRKNGQFYFKIKRVTVVI